MLVGGANPLINLVVSVVCFLLSYFIFSIVFTGDCLFRIRFSLLLAL